ncbi:MAG: hypothetical protein ACQERX_03090 [Bacillota bacterium]
MKKLLNLVYGLPIVLFFMSAFTNLAATNTGEPIFGTTLLDQEITMFGTLFSPIFIYLLLGIVGLTLIISYDNQVKNLGKSFYSIAILSSFLIYKTAGISEDFISQTDSSPANSLGFGGILLLTSAIIGLIIVLVFVFTPIIKMILDKVYGVEGELSKKTKKIINPFEELREWKLLLDENIVSEEEYKILKDNILDKIKLKKGDSLENIKLLKEVENEGLITTEDFKNKKKELI